MNRVRGPRARRGRAAVLGVLAVLAGCAWFDPSGTLLRTGKKLEAKGKAAEAAAAYLKLIEKYPKSPEAPEAMFRAAQVQETQSKFPEALDLYERFYRGWADRPEANDALSHAASILDERMGQWQKAAADLQELRARTVGTPDAPKIMYRLARVLEHSGTPYTDALEMYGLICKDCASAKEAVFALLAAARLHETMKDWSEAKRCYVEALAKLGAAPEANTVRSSLQAVELQEAWGVYYGGDVDGGTKLAEEALSATVTVPEVKLGLESLLQRRRSADRLVSMQVAATYADDVQRIPEPDAARFVQVAQANDFQAAPAGWTLTVDAKRKRFRLAQDAGGAGGRKGRKGWSFASPEDRQVLGVWWNREGDWLAWISKSPGGTGRRLDTIDLKRHRTWRVSPPRSSVGAAALFLPRSRKLVFADGPYLVFSDPRGGDRTEIKVPDVHGPAAADGAKFAGGNLAALEASADGLEIAAGVVRPAKGKSKAAAPATAWWRFSLAAFTE